ncbi:MAG: DUF362 domain-containing protein [Dehalococcoidia bacterium]|nr:DUF362 domain-containing protein [Dehalococcoidia bacterium]
MQRVLITNANYRNCRRAIEEALSAFPLAIRGRKVLVKINGMTDTEPEQGLILHPAFLRALLGLLEEMGAGEIMVGDNPGINYYGRNEAAFKASGLWEAAGAHYLNLGREARLVPFDPTYMNSVFPSSAVLDADIVISVPKFKTHARAGLSVALKNSFGILPGAQKSNLHHRAPAPRDFARMLAQVFRLRPPDLVIVDGILAGQGIGPYSPDLRYLGLVMASDNGVAMDATVARMMGYDPDQAPLLRFAQELGLGSYREEDIEVMGNFAPIPGFTVPPLADISSTEPIGYKGGMAESPFYRPKVDASKCDGCCICAEGCPPGALTMSEGLPRLDASLCVPCFCCQEVCPRQAIAVGKV